MTLNELAKQLFQAKRTETAAKEERIAIEEAIAAIVTIDGDRGSRTEDAGDGLKVTVERKWNYKADIAGIRALDLPDDAMIPLKHVPASYAFDATAYEKIRQDHPDVASRLAGLVTATPAKVSVSLKLA